jgi:hypothetical protein
MTAGRGVGIPNGLEVGVAPGVGVGVAEEPGAGAAGFGVIRMGDGIESKPGALVRCDGAPGAIGEIGVPG